YGTGVIETVDPSNPGIRKISPRLDPDLEQSFRIRNNRFIGGFNVSNLMVIERRMIDIGKEITLNFL
ncbi:MAG: hypothetical protein ACK55Z_12405, partial [bacterium]